MKRIMEIINNATKLKGRHFHRILSVTSQMNWTTFSAMYPSISVDGGLKNSVHPTVSVRLRKEVVSETMMNFSRALALKGARVCLSDSRLHISRISFEALVETLIAYSTTIRDIELLESEPSGDLYCVDLDGLGRDGFYP